MSIIFGYINLNGKPIERETLESMKHAMDFWGPDKDGLWHEGACGLGNLLLYNTPEALYENLPMTDASGNLVLTAGARIDNRDELFRIFDIPLGQRLTMPDSALMLKAYEKWGEACANYLIGDWAFAVWDKKLQKLFLARDHHGITALYYYKGSDFFVFSSSLKGILCLPQVPKKINEFKIAQLLVNWNEGGPETCYLDILRLPPAHTLTMHESKVTTNRYWFLEHTPEVRLKNDQEYIDMFLDLYTEAVRCRLRSYRPVGATLSGGLDSGSVCVLAARELAKESKRLQAYTAVPLYDITGLVPKNRIGDEGPLAQALADKMGNIDITFCRAENISPLEGVEKVFKIHDQPGFATGNAYWLVNIFTESQNFGIGTLLVGQNGNGTVSWPTRGLMSKMRHPFIQMLRGYKHNFKFLIGNWKDDFFINATLLEKYNLKQLIKEARLRPYFMNQLSLSDIRLQIIMPGESSIGNLLHENGIYYRFELRDPTIDVCLLKFLFGIHPNSNFYNNRQLFAINFKKCFPDYLINGTIRGIQAFDLIQRLNNNKYSIKYVLTKPGSKLILLNQYVALRKLLDCNESSYVKELLKIYSIKIFLESHLRIN